MKKIFLSVFMICALLVGALGQDITFRDKDYDIKDVRKVYTGIAGDTLDATYTLSKIVFVGKMYPYDMNVQIEADSSGDGGNVTIKLQGSWDNSTYYDITSAVTWYLTDSDTTLSLNNFSYTESQALGGYYMTSDTTGFANKEYAWPDTVSVTSQTVTITKTALGLRYPYVKVLFTGADASADMELEKLIWYIWPNNELYERR